MNTNKKNEQLRPVKKRANCSQEEEEEDFSFIYLFYLLIYRQDVRNFLKFINKLSAKSKQRNFSFANSC